MTMLLPLFILVGFIAGYFVNAMAYHLSPLEDKTALTFRQVLVHFWQKKYAWHDTVPLILCVAAAIACALAPFTPIVTGALFLYFCFALTLSVIDFRTQLLPDKLTLPLLWLGLVFNAQSGLIDLHDAVYGAVAGYGVLWCVYWGVWLVCHKEGLGYGDFKLAVGEAVVDHLRPIQEEFTRLIGDKAYLEQCYTKSAETALRISQRTLDKAMKKVGFVKRAF